ncbi:MAG: Replicative DNA helicase [Phycisphaerae bacterium]|nr:Replicative DNA helicase [Phycisphaerae bacterium]
MSQAEAQPTSLLERLPPQSIQAERCVLGSMLLDAACVGEVMQVLTRDHFVRDGHQVLFETLVHLYDTNQGSGIDLVTVRDHLERAKLLSAVGGMEAIVEIVETVPSADHALYYANIVRDKYTLRCVIQTATEVLREAFDASEDPSATIDRCEQKIYQLAEKHAGAGAIELKALLDAVYETIGSSEGSIVTGLPTGFLKLDELTSGLQPNEMIIIAARPSMGKTAFALNIAEHMAADNNIPVAFFSLEMAAQQLAQRLLASRAEIPGHKLRRRMLNDEEFGRLALHVGALSEAPLFIDDQPSLTVMQLRARARRLKNQHDIKCIFVDYLQLMDAPSGRDISRQQQISDISRGLKALARELRVPVVALSQLNRSPEGREGHKPRMSDLRESGSIEQDADVVMLLHREEYYHIGQEEVPEEIRGVGEVIVAKQRNGPTGNIKLQFSNETMRFRNLAEGFVPAGGDDF